MKAPEIKHYINWLGRVEYRNINCSFTYDETSYAAIDRIFRLPPPAGARPGEHKLETMAPCGARYH